MSHEELEALLLVTAKQALHAKYLVIALTQLLVENGVLKEPEEELLRMLDMWAKDLQQDDALEFKIEERVRKIREAWNMPPGR